MIGARDKHHLQIYYQNDKRCFHSVQASPTAPTLLNYTDGVYYFVEAGYETFDALGGLDGFFFVLELEVSGGHCRALEEPVTRLPAACSSGRGEESCATAQRRRGALARARRLVG